MPNEYVSSIYEIDLDQLWASGKRLILSDLDNTLVPWNHPLVPDELRAWLEAARARGFNVCIVSNNGSGRVDDFAKVSGLPAIGAAKKPKADGFYQALAKFHFDADQTVMIGDQLFTDIRGGNMLGMYTILVMPMTSIEWWGTRIMRRVERMALRKLARTGLKAPVRRNREEDDGGSSVG